MSLKLHIVRQLIRIDLCDEFELEQYAHTGFSTMGGMGGCPPIGPIFAFASSSRPLAPPSERLKMAIFWHFSEGNFCKI